MTKLPRAIQQQVDDANALMLEAAKPAPTPEVAPAPELPAPASTPSVSEAAPAVQTAPQDVNWEHKFRTLQGIFNAEVPKLQQQNKDLSARLQDAIERMEKSVSAQPPVQQPQAPTADPKDVEDFGQDLVEMVQRQTQAVLGRMAGKLDGVVGDIEKRLTQLEQSLKGTAQTVALTAEETFFSKLTQQVPDWEKINADDRFLTWLAEVDPIYGQPRQAALEAAQRALDVNRVANVFKAFQALLPQTPKVDAMSKQVSPKSSAPSAPAAPNEKRSFTQREVTAFYDDVAKRKYRGREQDAARLEAQINAAIAEGRILDR